MSKPDLDLVDEEAAEQGSIDDRPMSAPEKVAARDEVRKRFDAELDTGRSSTPAHE